jgi:hypothetical protein
MLKSRSIDVRTQRWAAGGIVLLAHLLFLGLLELDLQRAALLNEPIFVTPPMNVQLTRPWRAATQPQGAKPVSRAADAGNAANLPSPPASEPGPLETLPAPRALPDPAVDGSNPDAADQGPPDARVTALLRGSVGCEHARLTALSSRNGMGARIGSPAMGPIPTIPRP